MKTAILIFLVLSLTCLVGCGDGSEVMVKYTEETAKAIIESGWKIAGAIILGSVLNAVLK